jgi:hypothetical protein
MRSLAIMVLATLALAAGAGAQEASTNPPRTTYGDAYLGMPFEEWLNINGIDATMTDRCAGNPDANVKKGCEAWAQFKDTVRSGQGAAFPMLHTDVTMQGSSYLFRDKKLAGLFLMFTGHAANYETQLVNLTGKYGSPIKTDSTISHDQSGATWAVRSTMWEMSDGSAIKLSDGPDRDPAVIFVQFQSKEEVSRANAATQQELHGQNP